MSDGPNEWIVVTDDAKTLPAIEILTGRGFITGKSGSGKSNTASVVSEELLEAGFNMLIVDTEGEYFGLKEEYELVHAGRQDQCDIHLEPGGAAEIADVTLDQNIPVIFDVSMFDLDTAGDLIQEVTEALFERERELQKPYLLLVEEIQEYLPQSGAKDDLSKLLLRVAKRGRKRGLGLCGISQRPSSVDKDFITQCDWMVWHRLTWENDVKVVRNILGDEISAQVPDLEDGEAYLMTDWDDQVERVKFRKKRTFDAGATPGLDAYEDSNDLADAASASDELSVDPDFGDQPSNSTRNDPDFASEQENGDFGGQSEVPEKDNIEVESMTEQELREALREERRRSQILEDEVTELRKIYEDIDSIAPDRNQIPFSSDRTGSSSSEASPPTPTEREEQELDSAASILLEFGYLLWYIMATLRRRVAHITQSFRRTPAVGASSQTYPIARSNRLPPAKLLQLALITLLLISIVTGFLVWTAFF